ncbi:MAG: LPS export ABC transporter permease LptG [Gammaproteobacteria bacterium]
MSILDRYLGGVILQYTCVSMLALLALFTFVNLLDQLGDIGRGDYAMMDALAYVALIMPRSLYELFPMAALLGVTIGLSLLATDSELTALRASGVSVLQIALAALKTGAVFMLAAVLVGELLAPPADARAQRGRAEALQQHAGRQTSFGLWLRDAGAYVNIGEVLPDLSLIGVKFFEFDSGNKLRAMTFAAHGRVTAGRWALNDVAQTRFTADGEVETAHFDALEWRSQLTPNVLSVFLLQPDQLSLQQLRRHIRHLRQNRQQSAPYELAFWSKLMLPLSVAVMVVLAIPFVFANLRSGALGRSLFTGIMLGLGFYAANKGFGYVSLAFALPPLLGATLPMAAFLLLALLMMRRIA